MKQIKICTINLLASSHVFACIEVGFHQCSPIFDRKNGQTLQPFVSNGEVFIADTFNHRVRKVLRNGQIVTIAGTGECFVNWQLMHN